LTEVERVVTGRRIEPELLKLVRTKVADAIQPIDDIRSTAKYRAAVAGNLVVEFLQQLRDSSKFEDYMSDTLARWNFLPATAAVDEILPCCGSRAWAERMVTRRPLTDEKCLLAASDESWRDLTESDWLEAFRSHPRIGESGARKAAAPQSATWSRQEQRNVADADDSVKLALAEGNREYELRFKRIFIVCAAGKSPAEILELLRRRMENDDRAELQEAAEQQRQITQTRLKRWLQG
jgi:2-oxo-4-hydroxy-4-carboxy-5-ureidoimidazoline decarboxylase